MVNKTVLKITCLYFVFFVVVLLYGIGLINKAYNYKEADLEYAQKEIILEDNALRVVFFDGYITMYYENVPFTESNGLASSFTIGGVEYPTFKAKWRIERISPVELFATNEWPGFDIRQTWHFLLKDGKLNWQIDLESKKETTLINIGVVFLFRNNYQEWISLSGQGKTPILGILQQRKGIRIPFTSNALGFKTSGKDERLFPAVGLILGDKSFFNKALLSSCRGAFSNITYLSLAFGGKEPLRIFKNSKITLSSGQMAVFDKKGGLLKYLQMKQAQIRN